MTEAFETVIGLEVHVQLQTASKLFCPCPNAWGAAPNTQVCPVCTGQPGTLPVLNEHALRLAVRAGLALGCTIARHTAFDRKNYFYPDLPKGYQISQLRHPVAAGGALAVASDDDAPRVVHVVRAHLEEDAGKSTHPERADHSLVDLNRAGIPLLEIVTGPDLRSPAEAQRWLEELKRRLRYTRVSECDMEKGSLRCDANVSIRPLGATTLGTRTEIKNLNSFRNVARALEHEIARQTALVEGGGTVVQETRTWREDAEQTAPLRSKEEAQDYRYFPDPDLPPFALAEEWIAGVLAELPEMPDQRLARYVDVLGVPEEAARVLVADREPAEYFDRCVELGGDLQPAALATYVTNAVLALANERNTPPSELPIRPDDVVAVVRMVEDGALSHQAARRVLAEVGATGAPPEKVVKELGLAQISDQDELARVVGEVIAQQPKAVEEYRQGKEKALNALVGAVMKETRGKANPNLVRDLLVTRLREPAG